MTVDDDNNPLETRKQSLLREGLSIETIDELMHECNALPLPITFELKAYEISDECAELHGKHHQNRSESGPHLVDLTRFSTQKFDPWLPS
jgi:hypothetical protein